MNAIAVLLWIYPIAVKYRQIFYNMLMVCLQCIVVNIIGYLMANGRDVKTRYGGGWKSSVCRGGVEIVIHRETGLLPIFIQET